ncbi:hypothetical protein B0J14DRAFT_585143 [Halenospora varia]|nr:hypothetical protein B0J14DRAFT_585143 [Halenospora varia]
MLYNISCFRIFSSLALTKACTLSCSRCMKPDKLLIPVSWKLISLSSAPLLFSSSSSSACALSCRICSSAALMFALVC